MKITVRRAKTADVATIRRMVAPLARQRVLLDKDAVTYYESIQEFKVAEDQTGAIVGFGALHVMWEHLAEIRTLATHSQLGGRGIGSALVKALLDEAEELGVSHVFCLTFETEFFSRHGFVEMKNQNTLEPEVYAELLRSTDEGVAEFLDLARVKPNTLGNTRMILDLSQRS